MAYKNSPDNCGGRLEKQTDGSWFCNDCGHRVTFPESKRTSKTTIDGVVAFHVSVKITKDQLEKMSPERIAAFFDGIAKAQAAASGRE